MTTKPIPGMPIDLTTWGFGSLERLIAKEVNAVIRKAFRETVPSIQLSDADDVVSVNVFLPLGSSTIDDAGYTRSLHSMVTDYIKRCMHPRDAEPAVKELKRQLARLEKVAAGADRLLGTAHGTARRRSARRLPRRLTEIPDLSEPNPGIPNLLLDLDLLLDSGLHIPPGDYQMQLESVARRGFKGEELLIWKFGGLEGAALGHKFSLYTCFKEEALWKLKQTLQVLGVEVPNSAFDVDLRPLIGKKVIGIISDGTYRDTVFSRLVKISAG